MKKNIVKYSSLIIGTILFVLSLHYVGLESVIKSLVISDFSQFVLYIVISIFIFVGLVIRWQLILKCHNYKISIGKLFNYRLAGFAVSYLTPTARLGGEPVRTYFIVKDGVPLEKAMSSVFIDKSLEVTANAVMTILGILSLLFVIAFSSGLKWIIAIFILLSVYVIYIFYSRLFAGMGIFTSILRFLRLTKVRIIERNYHKIRESELDMTHFFNNYKRVFILSTCISFFLYILSIFEFRYLVGAFGYQADFYEAFLILAVVGVAYMVPVPGALGVLEGAQVSLFRALGKGAYYGIGVSLATRVRDLLWTIYGLTYLYLRGIMINNLLRNRSGHIQVSEKVSYFKKWKVK